MRVDVYREGRTLKWFCEAVNVDTGRVLYRTDLYDTRARALADVRLWIRLTVGRVSS